MTARLPGEWDRVPGYLNASTLGLPPRVTVAAMHRGIDQWQAGTATPMQYDAAVSASRRAYARLVGVPVGSVAIGAQVSALVATVATALPAGALVVVPTGEFTSVTEPFGVQAARGIRVVAEPLTGLADRVSAGCDAVAFSLAQSATGDLADAPSVTAAARAVGALVVCDTTQAAGWLPIEAAMFDVTVCAGYKWLCCPRGTAFMTVATTDTASRMTPVLAGWYAGEDPWTSVYSTVHLASDARRFDTSPAWLSWLGTRTSLELFADADPAALHRHGAGLADELRVRLQQPPAGRPVVTLADPDGALASALAREGATVAVRAGRVRVGFHVWNTPADVDLVVRCAAGDPA